MLDETQELALIRSVLVDAFPDESRRVGKTNLNDIVQRRGEVIIVPMTGASNLEWTDALTLLASAAVLVSQWLTDRGKVDRSIHFRQEVQVTQNVRIGRIDGESRVSVSNPIDFTIPPEIADRLDSATVDRLLSSFTAHLDALNAQGGDADARE